MCWVPILLSPSGLQTHGCLGPRGTVKLARKPAPREVRMQPGFIQILSQQTRRLRERVSAGVGLAWASRRGAARCHTGRARKGKKPPRGVNSQQNGFV